MPKRRGPHTMRLIAICAFVLAIGPTLAHLRSHNNVVPVGQNCTTTCSTIGNQRVCQTHCY